MPDITKISPQKRKDRYNIFLDEKFAFGVSLTTLVSQSLKIGSKLESEQIKKILKKLKSLKYLNDLEFANWWTEARAKQSKGPRLIKAELNQKGIDSQIIDKALLSLTNQKELAQKAIEKKIKTWKNLSGDQLKRKIYTHLASRGFDWDTIKETFAFLEKRS